MSTEEKATESQKQKRTRSPAYPAIDLKSAIGRAGVLWTKINRHSAPVDSIGGYWGYEKNSSKAISESSALIKYGLLKDDGNGVNRTIQLTDRGIKLSYNPDTDSPQYWEEVKKAALSPAIHQELWERYSGQLPDDAVIKRYLVVDRRFNEQYVDDFINQFKATIEFAKLSVGDMLVEDDSTDRPIVTAKLPLPPPRRSTEPLGQFVHPKPADQPPDITAPPIPSRQNPSELSLPLESGKSVIVPRMTKDDYDLFLDTLKLWERRIVIKQPEPGIKFPAQALWKNKDFDKPVTIVGIAGQMNGETFYQSEDGTGIPAKELVFN